MTTDGTVTEYPIPTASSGAIAIIQGSDGNVWFTENGAAANAVARVTTEGAITEFRVAEQPAPAPSGSAPLPGGNLAVAETNTTTVATVTTAGAITETRFRITAPMPGGITLGPDGNLWFTEKDTNAIGKMSPAGTLLAEYPVPTAGKWPRADRGRTRREPVVRRDVRRTRWPRSRLPES